MQLMPATAARMAREARTEPPGPDTLTQPSVNITLGTIYLGSLVRSFHSVSAALAAYNAGERRAEEWLSRDYSATDEFVEDIPYQETRNYIKRILGTYLKYMKVRPPELMRAANIL
jgi:soluble lytic murein transglycosylase